MAKIPIIGRAGNWMNRQSARSILPDIDLWTNRWYVQRNLRRPSHFVNHKQIVYPHYWRLSKWYVYSGLIIRELRHLNSCNLHIQDWNQQKRLDYVYRQILYYNAELHWRYGDWLNSYTDQIYRRTMQFKLSDYWCHPTRNRWRLLCRHVTDEDGYW